MSKRFSSQQEIDEFLAEPRLAILMYNGKRPAPTGVPVWFDCFGSDNKPGRRAGSLGGV